jgi:hypothetical protein
MKPQLPKILLIMLVLVLVAPVGLPPSFCDGNALLSIQTVSPPPPLSDRDKKQMADEIKQGQDAAADVAKEAKLVKDKAQNDRVNAIGQRLAAVANTTQYPAGYGNDRVFPFAWHFHIIEDKEINAFSLPGGQVYINSGLLKNVRSDDELAGVLGHEMTHSAHHHIQSLSHEQSKMSTEMIAGLLAAVLAHVPSQDIGNLAAGAQYAQLGIMNTKYSQQAERDADHGGTILMQKAGFNPVGMLTFMQRLGDYENETPKVQLGIFQDHPEAADRVAAISQELSQMNVPITVGEIRQVTNAPHATYQQSPTGGEDIVFAGRTLPALSDPDLNRTKAIVTKFNSLLDGGIQLYQIEYSGDQVLVSDQPLITITQADLALHPGATPEALAQAASNALRSGIYSQAFSSIKM